MKNALLHDGLAFWARETPERAALVFGDEAQLTYGELAIWSDAAAARLQQLGVQPGDRVAIAAANSLEWVVGAFAILKAGGVIVPFNERFVRDEFAYLVGACTPRIVLVDGPRAEIFRDIPGDHAIATLDEVTSGAASPPGWRAVRVNSEALAQIIFTSGTTGRPKGVMISHGQLLSKYYEMYLTLPAFGGPTMRQLLTVSLQSGVGTTWGYLFTTTNGGVFSFLRRFDPAVALRLLVEQRITFMATFPLVLDQLARQPEFAAADLRELRLAVTGGTRIPPEVLTLWRAKDVLLRSMYGLTEGGNYVTIATETEVRGARTSCGRPMQFTQLRIVGPDGADRPAGEPGEIIVKGPGMMVGYWNDPEATERTMIDGWVHTGDLGVLDAEGYLSFVDRAKDMIISSGFNISPSEVERVVADYPGVIEVGVIAVSDPRFGEVPAACVLTEGPTDAAAIFEHCRERLAGFKRPRYVIPLAQPLPRNANGKVDKKALTAAHADAPARYPKLG